MARRHRGGRHDDHDADDRRHRRRHPKPTRRHRKPKPKPKAGPPPQTVTEQLKEKSQQSGQDAMGAAPGFYPADPANQQAVFTTGPGQAVEYNYVRVDSGPDEYALAQSEQYAPVPIAGYGQMVTSGAASNPT